MNFSFSQLLRRIPGLLHGYSTRSHGNTLIEAVRARVVTSLGLAPSGLVWQEQVHGAHVYTASQEDRGNDIRGVDALVYRRDTDRPHPSVVLSVHVADCVPLLFADPLASVIAVAHAGWRGTLLHITKNVLESMVKLGANKRDIVVSIGPHIAACCYSVPKERALAFRKSYPRNGDLVVSSSSDSWRIDIGKANYIDLVSSGVAQEHIDSPVYCTSCQCDRYFSFRKDGKETFGEIMGVLSYEPKN